MEFSQINVGEQFFFNRDKFKKTTLRSAFKVIRNNVLSDEFSFYGDEKCEEIADSVELIPLLPKDELAFRCAHIKAIIKGKIVKVESEDDYFNISYIWDPKFTKEKIPALEVIAEIHTFHAYGYYGLFKPSIAEVVAQIPSEISFEQIYGFEILDEMPKDANDLNKYIHYTNAGYHVARTVLYKKA